jgi:hypothetical protein
VLLATREIHSGLVFSTLPSGSPTLQDILFALPVSERNIILLAVFLRLHFASYSYPRSNDYPYSRWNAFIRKRQHHTPALLLVNRAIHYDIQRYLYGKLEKLVFRGSFGFGLLKSGGPLSWTEEPPLQ